MPADLPDDPWPSLARVGSKKLALVTGRTGDLPRFGPRSAVALLLCSLVGLAGLGWPFLVPVSSPVAHERDAPLLFAALVVLVLVVVLTALTDGTADAKSVALLGVLAALAAALRPLGVGAAGLEPMFVVLVLGGRVLGPAFGFALGATAMFASALITAGVGPWLAYQMLTAAWIGFGAGVLPGRLRGRAEVALLAGYAVVAGIGYGVVMNLWFWPFALDLRSPLAPVPGAGAAANAGRYAAFYLATSAGWDLVRGVLNATLVLLAGPRLLSALRRAVRHAAFRAPITIHRPPPS